MAARLGHPSGTAIVQQVLEEVFHSGQISRQQHLHLSCTILSDLRLSGEERRQINRVFDYVQTGRLQLID